MVDPVAVSGRFHEGEWLQLSGVEICVYSPRVRRPDLDLDV
jgi:hypothetical protein